LFPARVGFTIAEIDEFATLEPICFIPLVDNNQDPDPNMHDDPSPSSNACAASTMRGVEP